MCEPVGPTVVALLLKVLASRIVWLTLDEVLEDAVIRPVVRPVVRFVKTVVVKVVQLIVAAVRRWWFNFVNRLRAHPSVAQPVAV
jgi:hypothetical protein